jgi:hypothetical protein
MSWNELRDCRALSGPAGVRALLFSLSQLYRVLAVAGCCACVAGPTGCGKSATLRVLAESMGFELTEWQAPVPTLWQDYQYQVGSLPLCEISALLPVLHEITQLHWHSCMMAGLPVPGGQKSKRFYDVS